MGAAQAFFEDLRISFSATAISSITARASAFTSSGVEGGVVDELHELKSLPEGVLYLGCVAEIFPTNRIRHRDLTRFFD